MQEPERQRHLGRVETGAGLVKFAGTLDLEHQIAAVHVLHDEKQPVLRGGGGGLQISGQCRVNYICINPTSIKKIITTREGWC